jgi:mRNA interferase HigB
VWVISRKRLREFWEIHRDAERPLRLWYKVAAAAEWRSLVDVRSVFPHADPVTTSSGALLTVFNAGGNKYRLITRIEYKRHKVYVKHVLTHAEYTRGDWKNR